MSQITISSQNFRENNCFQIANQFDGKMQNQCCEHNFAEIMHFSVKSIS